MPTVAAEFLAENDGSVESNQVTINNQLPFDFYNGRIRFLMKKGEYEVNGGEILSLYDYEGGTKAAVVVNVNIKRNSVIQVFIEKK